MSVIDWIIRKGLAHPRADVDGVRSDGSMKACMLRELDLSVVPTVYVGSDSEEFPGRELNAIVSVEESVVGKVYSSRIRHCLPVIIVSDGEDIVKSATYKVQT